MISDYVLSTFPKKDKDKLMDMIEKAADAVEFGLKSPFEQTMAKFNN